jgi:hypothetical protein
MVESNVTANVDNLFTLIKLAFSSNFSSLLIVFRRMFTWIALGDAGLRFSLILLRKANAVKGGTTSAAYHQRNQSTHATDVVTVTSISAGLQHTRAANDHLCEVSFNRKISPIVDGKSH